MRNKRTVSNAGDFSDFTGISTRILLFGCVFGFSLMATGYCTVRAKKWNSVMMDQNHLIG